MMSDEQVVIMWFARNDSRHRRWWGGSWRGRAFRWIRALRDERSRTRHNVITRLVSVHLSTNVTVGRDGRGRGAERGRQRDYTWRGERQLILTFLSENQSVVIPEAACVISSLSAIPPRPQPGFALFSGKSHGPSATPVSTFPQTLFSAPHRTSSIGLIRPARRVFLLAPYTSR